MSNKFQLVEEIPSNGTYLGVEVYKKDIPEGSLYITRTANGVSTTFVPRRSRRDDITQPPPANDSDIDMPGDQLAEALN